MTFGRLAELGAAAAACAENAIAAIRAAATQAREIANEHRVPDSLRCFIITLLRKHRKHFGPRTRFALIRSIRIEGQATPHSVFGVRHRSTELFYQ